MTGRAQPITSVACPLRHRARQISPRAARSLGLVLALALTACLSKKEIEEAKVSSYDTEFAVVFEAAAAAVREPYPNVTENQQKGLVSTSWHQVYLAGDATDPSAAQASSRTPGGSHMPSSALPGDSALKRYFIRFDVTVAGGRPWRVRIVGHAAQWDSGNAVPTELRGAARPRWLENRTEALLVDIHRKLKKFAVNTGPAEVTAEVADEGPRSDPKAFAGVPAEAAQVLAGLRDEILRRDWTRMRARFADDVVWSLGAEPGLDTALALWQADPTALDEMQKALDAGCAAAGAELVCPKAATAAGFAGYRLTLAQRAGAWKVVSFVSGL